MTRDFPNYCDAVREDFRKAYNTELTISDEEIFRANEEEEFSNLNVQNEYFRKAQERFLLRQDMGVGTAEDVNIPASYEIGAKEEAASHLSLGYALAHEEMSTHFAQLILAYIAFCEGPSEANEKSLELAKVIFRAYDLTEDDIDGFEAMVHNVWGQV